MGQTSEEAGEQAQKILELAGAWSAWSGGQISVQDASEKLVKGMMGQTRGLIELGLKVTEQEVAARMAAEGLTNLTGAEASRAQQQVMWTLIQEKSTTAVGAYGEALDGSYGAAMSMATAVDEIKDRIGELVIQLAPAIIAMAELLGLATSFATLDFTGVSEWVYKTNFLGVNDIDVLAAELQQRAQAEAYKHPFNIAFPMGVTVDQSSSSHAFDPTGLSQQINQGFLSGTGLGIAWQAAQSQLHARWQDTIVQPIVQARRDMLGELRKTFDVASNVLTEFELPELDWATLLANASAWQSAQEDVAALMSEVGARGSQALLLALGTLDPQTLAWVAANWGGAISQLYGLFPGTHPGPNAPQQYPAGEGPGGGSGGGGGRFVSAGKGVSVNIGMVVGDDAAVDKAVSTALRRAKQRGM
jgi:hypothetical protein